MYAEMAVAHTETRESDIQRNLVQVFGPNNRDVVLEESPVCLSRRDAWRQLVLYASERPPYRIICLPVTSQELQVVVESVEEAEIRDACQSAWDGMRRVLAKTRPTLQKLELKELGHGRPFLTATTGWVAELQSREVWELILVGLISSAVVGAGVFTFARDEVVSLIIGAVPGLVSLGTAVATAAVNWKRGKLRWR